MEMSLEKLQAMVDGLVNEYLSTVFTFRVLYPMLYNKDVIARHGSGKRAAGFISIRFGLYCHVIQQCWKMGCDSDRKSFSAERIFNALGPCTIAKLRHRYGDLKNRIDDSVDDATRKHLEMLNELDEQKRLKEFDESMEDLKSRWTRFKESSFYSAVSTARNKVAAHSEVGQKGNGFHVKDLPDIGIEWGDERLFIEGLRSIVDLLNQLIRQSSFAWGRFEDQTKSDAQDYWA